MQQAWALAIALLALTPGAVALSPVPLLAPPQAPEPSQLPPACIAENGTYACQWTYNSSDHPDPRADLSARWEVPTFPKTLATITVSLEGTDGGWAVDLWRTTTTKSAETNSTLRERVSASRHSPDAMHPDFPIRDTTTHVLDGGDRTFNATGLSSSTNTTLVFSPFSSSNGPGGATLQRQTPTSGGTFHIYYAAEPVPVGTPHERPAATRGYPQLKGQMRDAPRPEMDLVAGWLDDAVIDDGLMDVHLAIAGDLSRIDWNGTSSPAPSAVSGATLKTQEIDWALHFKVQGSQYFVKWAAVSGGPFEPIRSCGLYRIIPQATSTPAPPVQPGATETLVSSPHCTFTNDTLDAEFPELSVGSPGPGVIFQELSANADEIQENTGNRAQSRDKLDSAHFTFALGGPIVWDTLNGCHFCPPAPTPWYTAPLAPENIPNTLQVGGAGVAGGAFLVGLFLVRRRRVAVAKLFAEVARAEELHERDTRAALLALGRLDSRFADLFHKGKLTEGQYQAVSQRVATAATRFALRQGLGMDDGVATPGRARTIPVQDGSGAPVRPHEG